MTKRGKRGSLIVVGAVVVALVALAFVFREQPPYEFLRSAERWYTFVSSSAVKDRASTVFVTDLSVRETADLAEEELAPKGWTRTDTVFRAPSGSAYGYISVFDGDKWVSDARLRGKTGIIWNRPPTTMDRITAWLDRVTGRS